MPVRSLNSSVVKWPDLETVDRAVRLWVKQQLRFDDRILRAGYFGSYARGDWGVHSDLDLILIVRDDDRPFEERSLAWDVLSLPVPVDLLVYTLDEWQSLLEKGGRFAREVEQEAVWIVP